MTRVAPASSPPTTCRVALSPADLADHFAVRQLVFVTEQGIFPVTDRDLHDDSHQTIHLVGSTESAVVGAVRLYPLEADADIWQGDRLAVAPEFRVFQLGSDLVRLAVETARQRGGREMKAHIQAGNVRFFERLGWTIDGPAEIYHSRPHQPMAIDLRY